MKFLKSLRKRFSGGEPVELEELEDAESFFREKRSDELEKIKEEKNRFRDRVEEALEEMDEILESLEDFEDEKRRAVIEDVVSNLVEERRKLIEEFNHSSNPEKLWEELNSFLEQYQSIDQKEQAVIEEAGVEKKFGDSLKQVKELQSELEKFRENRYNTRKKYGEIKNKMEEKQDLEDEKQEIESRIEKIRIEKLEEEIKEKKSELGELEDSEAMNELHQLENNLDDAEEEKKSLEKRIGKALSSSERGLKKLLYEGRIDGLSKKEAEILREVRDQEKKRLENENPETVEEAVHKTRESLDEFLEEKTREKLLNGLNTLKNFSQLQKEISEKEEKIESLEEEISNHTAVEKREELENEIDKLEKQLNQGKTEKQDLKQQKQDLNREIRELEDRVLELMENEFGQEFELKREKTS